MFPPARALTSTVKTLSWNAHPSSHCGAPDSFLNEKFSAGSSTFPYINICFLASAFFADGMSRGTCCLTARKGCRRSAIAAGVKSESMSHSDSSCRGRCQSRAVRPQRTQQATQRTQLPPQRTQLSPRRKFTAGAARRGRYLIRARLRPGVGNDGHGQSHRPGKHTHGHQLLHTPPHHAT
jgi:hypothetical protein